MIFFLFWSIIDSIFDVWFWYKYAEDVYMA